MPALATRPIVPATYSAEAPDPSTLTPGMVKRARRTVARAKALIEEKGWVQRAARGPNGELCATEAIREARQVKSKAGLIPLTSPKMQRAITGVLEEARPLVTRRAPAFQTLFAVADWNDKSGRTRDQVLALLDKAANG